MTQSERRRRFDALFATYSSDIVAYCGWRADSASDAQDALAEVFLTAWRRLRDYPQRKGPGSRFLVVDGGSCTASTQPPRAGCHGEGDAGLTLVAALLLPPGNSADYEPPCDDRPQRHLIIRRCE
jgi:hypothetical protein